MRRTLTALILALALMGVIAMTQTHAGESSPPIAIAIHAGSGTINKGDFSADKEREIRETLERAVRPRPWHRI